MSFAGESLSTTTSQLTTFTHRWIVDNFSFRFWTSLESAQFSPPINPNLKVSLKLCPIQDNEIFYNGEAITDDEIGVYLHMHSKCSPVLRVKFWLSGYRPHTHCYSEKMISSGQGKVGSFLRSYLKEHKFSLLPNDKLTICCEISYITDSITNSQQATANQVQMLCENAQKLSLESYRSLMESGKHSDVVICVDESEEGNTKEFPLHKNILSGKSSVFEAMFKNDMKEAEQNRVLITDVEVKVFELLIRFVYYGNIEQLDKYAMELMEVADKYDIAQLKLLCEQYLGANMSLDNVIDLLVYADMHNANELKDLAMDFIKKNYISVVKSEKWKSLFKKQPKLFAELMDLNLGD